MSTVVAVPAEELRPWVRKVRSWLRDEDAAYEALLAARASGDRQLAERARRAHSETYHRSPTGRRPRRAREVRL